MGGALRRFFLLLATQNPIRKRQDGWRGAVHYYDRHRRQLMHTERPILDSIHTAGCGLGSTKLAFTYSHSDPRPL